MDQPILQTTRVCKDFGPVRVLHDISFALHQGTVHAVIGENGAGKSTLVKILSGYHQATEGEVYLHGRGVEFHSTKQAEDQGIIMIHQEFNLANDLTVEENIFLGKEIVHRGVLDKQTMEKVSQDVLASLQTTISPRAQVKNLSVSDKQIVEIAKAMARDAKILIMDEPTAVLTRSEIDVLFQRIRQLQADGVSIIYISHKLGEIKELANEVTVLRDGYHITSQATSELSIDDMARLMVGREVQDMFPAKNRVATPEPVLRVENVTSPGTVHGASFTLFKGEILGFAGLIGAGRTELIEAILGLRPRTTGSLEYRGEIVQIRDYEDAIAKKIVYLSEDRKGKGLLVNMDLAFNLTLLALKEYTHRLGLLDEQKERLALDKAMNEFQVRAPSPKAKLATLSGGNQQKIGLAKIMEIDPDVVVLDEPTRGIDVGTKQQIYFFVRELVKRGKSCIVISSELPEVIGLADRVMVMRNGTITGMLEGEHINEEEIMLYATGVKGGSSDETA